MKKLIKITTICSLLIIACLLISACGGGTEQLARNQGDVVITVTNAIGGAPLSGVTVQERQTAGTGTLINIGSTNASGQLRFTGTAGTTYFFTFSLTGFVTKTDIAATPQLTKDTPLPVTL
jgi:hypothetical protein